MDSLPQAAAFKCLFVSAIRRDTQGEDNHDIRIHFVGRPGAGRTAQFIASFDVPHSLKDVGVSRNEIQQIVPAVLHEVKERAVVDKPITEAEVVALLEASY